MSVTVGAPDTAGDEQFDGHCCSHGSHRFGAGVSTRRSRQWVLPKSKLSGFAGFAGFWFRA